MDADAFFASCEVALNPSLRGKPVITGLEKGIASSMSYEAKARGVTRAMRLWEIRKICPEAVIISSNFDTYTTFSRRMFNIVRRYADPVEEYSIDECFADLREFGEDKEKLISVGEKIKKDITRSLGITVSVGIAPSKVLAKVASKWQKPDGLIFISQNEIEEYLKKLPVGKVWGIGASTSIMLNKLGVLTAFDFISKPLAWVEEFTAKPYIEIWYELRGISVNAVKHGSQEKHKSISKTRMFVPPSSNKEFVFSELSKNIENACIKTRLYRIAPTKISFYLKTQDFRYFQDEVKLSKPIDATHEIINIVRDSFIHLYKPNILYRATGITFHMMSSKDVTQHNLFETSNNTRDTDLLYQSIDQIDRRFGKHTVFLASSLKALPKKSKIIKKELPLPYMGITS